MSAKYNKVKGYYDKDLWTISQVRNAVVKGWITAEEYEEITGETYAE
ncbi:MAG: XkdX family protein [Lachnospiraceae bacterium]|nr:XkdX family protein [Lachnospiraceae bacterium]